MSELELVLSQGYFVLYGLQEKKHSVLLQFFPTALQGSPETCRWNSTLRQDIPIFKARLTT